MAGMIQLNFRTIAMRKLSSATILSALLAISWVGFLASQPRAEERHHLNDKWDYKSTNKDSELFESGRNGWEAYAVIHREGDTQLTYCLKKRTN
jgi:hypothetical protein